MCDYSEKCRYNDTYYREWGFRKNFISLDISDLVHEKSWLKVFEMRKKSLHLQPQTKKNHEIFNEHNHT